MTIGAYRSWWVEDHRIAGRPLTLLLYALSREPGIEVTQSEAQRVLKIGKDAWIAAKGKLSEAGFLYEIWDRYPRNFSRDSNGHGIGGQKRFRIFLRDASPNEYHERDDNILKIDRAMEEVAPEDWPADFPVPGSWQSRSGIYLDEASWKQFERVHALID